MIAISRINKFRLPDRFYVHVFHCHNFRMQLIMMGSVSKQFCFHCSGTNSPELIFLRMISSAASLNKSRCIRWESLKK